MTISPGTGGGGAHAELVEQLALAFEEVRLPRTAGRILGHLLLTGADHLSLEELTSATGASKASMSTMARLLAERGYVELVPIPGGRRDHYRLTPDAWSQPTRRHADFLARLRGLAEQGGAKPAALSDLRDRAAALEEGVRRLLDEK